MKSHTPFALRALPFGTSLLALACSTSTATPGADGGNGTPVVNDAGVDTSAGGSDASVVEGGGSNGGDTGVTSGGEAGDTGPGGDAALPVVITYIPGVTVSTLAGSDVAGTQDGTGAAAQFDNPTGLAIDANGNLLETDYDSGRVRLVSPAGVVTTIAAGTNFTDCFSAVVSTSGAYYIGTDSDDTGTKSAMSGTVWLVTPAGGGALATPTVVAQGFGRPRGLAPSSGGNLFVADRDQDLAEVVSVASGQASVLAGSPGVPGFVNATGGSAQFNTPVGAAAMSDGSFLVTDSGNNVVRRVTAGGVVTTFAGNGAATLVDGPCASASFNAARGIAVDAAGNVYVSDIGDHVIRRISTGCTVETVAGNGVAGYADGQGSAAEFYGQEGIAVTPDGKTIYVADGNGGDGSAYQRIRAISIP
jgi:sugar lactone lactonase YvrE